MLSKFARNAAVARLQEDDLEEFNELVMEENTEELKQEEGCCYKLVFMVGERHCFMAWREFNYQRTTFSLKCTLGSHS